MPFFLLESLLRWVSGWNSGLGLGLDNNNYGYAGNKLGKQLTHEAAAVADTRAEKGGLDSYGRRRRGSGSGG